MDFDRFTPFGRGVIKFRYFEYPRQSYNDSINVISLNASQIHGDYLIYPYKASPFFLVGNDIPIGRYNLSSSSQAHLIIREPRTIIENDDGIEIVFGKIIWAERISGLLELSVLDTRSLTLDLNKGYEVFLNGELILTEVYSQKIDSSLGSGEWIAGHDLNYGKRILTSNHTGRIIVIRDDKVVLNEILGMGIYYNIVSTGGGIRQYGRGTSNRIYVNLEYNDTIKITRHIRVSFNPIFMD